MSLSCEAIEYESDDGILQKLPQSSNQISKDQFEDEELDYEEEVDDSKQHNNVKEEEEEEGELSDDDENIEESNVNNNNNIDKDEGELDEDDDLEEGEVKEDVENNDADLSNNDADKNFDNNRQKPAISQDIRGRELDRSTKPFYNKWPNSNQNYGNSRYGNVNRSDRYPSSLSNRTRDYNLQIPAQPTSESAWERGLKQARELLSRASKRKEEEVDFENKRFNLTVENEPEPPVKQISTREISPPPEKRRRHSSQQHSSSEDEVERRHRLAYDAAPWNNQNNSNFQLTSRNRANIYSSNRSAETFRDPWRRSKSPRPMQNRNKRPDVDMRYGEIYKREKNKSESRRSNSISSLSSFGSDLSNVSGSEKSSGRKLPYSRPNLSSKSKFDRDTDILHQNNRDFSKSRMDRIPKKINASPPLENDRVSETKSFDSWSESLSESDSSSFFTNSDSESDSADDKVVGDKSSASNRATKRAAGERRVQSSRLNRESKNSDTKISKSSAIDSKGASSKMSKYDIEKEAQKAVPIKMTFKKKKTSLKKDKLIDEQLNGDLSDIEGQSGNCLKSPKISSGESVNSKSPISYEEAPKKRSHKDSSNSSSKIHRREELLLKLKAVEEAIERKLNSKKEA